MKVEKIDLAGRLVYYFEVKGSKQYNQRLVVVNKEIIEWNCTCVFSSIYRFSKTNMEKDIKCTHIKKCIQYLKNKGELK